MSSYGDKFRKQENDPRGNYFLVGAPNSTPTITAQCKFWWFTDSLITTTAERKILVAFIPIDLM